jgi:inosine-uridine nucleoside N-ribohydrolase
MIIIILSTNSSTSAWQRQKIIIDTDAGVDDAFAIAMLLTAETFNEVDILAITTVSGNTDCRNVSLNVLKILDTAGRLDVSI